MRHAKTNNPQTARPGADAASARRARRENGSWRGRHKPSVGRIGYKPWRDDDRFGEEDRRD